MKKSLRRSLSAVTTGGSLFMVYTAGITCPLITDFFLKLGATEWHFGLINGLPTFLLCFQIIGAFTANRLKHRKPFFIGIYLVSRSLYLALAFAVLLRPYVTQNTLVLSLIGIITLSNILGNIAGPVWFSWMADLIPFRVLNSYWGTRQRAMYLSWVMSFLAITAFVYWADWPVETMARIVIIVAVMAGVSDILHFWRVDEPANEMTRGVPLLDILMAPLRNHNYRYFVFFWSFWLASDWMATGFMQLYAIKVLEVPVWSTTLIWCILGISTAFSSPAWGRMADKHGQKPILIMCMIFKPIVVTAFLLATKETALFLLPLAFVPDGILNSGLLVASNGFMLKMSPRKNRSMFTASIIAVSGLCGGLAVIIAGRMLHALENVSFHAGGLDWNNYRIIFATSLIMRLVCILLVFKITEPGSSRPKLMLHDILGRTPLRFIRFPAGLYNKLDNPD